MNTIDVISMGLNTDHTPGERRRDPGRPNYVLIQMLTPGYVNLANGIRRIEPYECVLYLPRAPRMINPESDDASFRNNWVFFRGDGAQELFDDYGILPGQIYRPSSLHSVMECFRMLFSEYISAERNKAELTTLIMRQIFIYLSRSSYLRSPLPNGASGYEEQLAQVRYDIYQYVARQWKIEDMARQTGVSPTWFGKLYRAQYGLSPKQDVLRARIEYAKSLLAYSDSSLQDIAQLSGFQNEYYFNRSFHSHTGVTPGEYRHSHHAE